MFGHMMKIIRADTPIEHLVQIQPKLKCFFATSIEPTAK